MADSVIVVQFAVNRSQENNRSQIYRGISNHAVTKIDSKELSMVAGGAAVTGTATSLLTFYASKPVTVALTKSGNTITLPGVKGLFSIPANVAYSITYPSGPDFVLLMVTD